jgi:hypothetical protein
VQLIVWSCGKPNGVKAGQHIPAAGLRRQVGSHPIVWIGVVIRQLVEVVAAGIVKVHPKLCCSRNTEAGYRTEGSYPGAIRPIGIRPTDNWLDTDLTVKAHGVVASSINRLVAFATSPNNQRHVYFVATDATIHQLYFNGTLWSDENLTNATDGGKATPYATAMDGCAVGNHQYVFFVSNTGHLHMYSYVNRRKSIREYADPTLRSKRTENCRLRIR